MVLVGNQEILEGPSDVTCLLYHSAVLKRVVRSSLAAEISQAAETLDQCEYVPRYARRDLGRELCASTVEMEREPLARIQKSWCWILRQVTTC